MPRLEIKYPVISPVQAGLHRPFWSVMIPTYNSAKYLGKALEGLLGQDPGPDEMQIGVVDDVSTVDDTEEMVRKIGKGRISFYRNQKHTGPYGSFNICIQRSTGRIVHILNSDDYVENNFYVSMRQLIDKYPEAALYVSRGFIVDESGEIDRLSERLKALETKSNDPSPFFYGNHFLTSGVVIRREFYEKYGGFYESLSHTADWELWIRAISSSSGASINKPLMCYRQHSCSHSSAEKKSSHNLEDSLKLCEIFTSLYPEFDNMKFRKMISDYGYERALEFMGLGDKISAINSGLFWWRNSRFRNKLWRVFEASIYTERTKFNLLTSMLLKK